MRDHNRYIEVNITRPSKCVIGTIIKSQIAEGLEEAQQMEEKLTANGVDFFDCLEQRDHRLKEAKNKWAVAESWTLYLGCPAKKGVATFKP